MVYVCERRHVYRRGKYVKSMGESCVCMKVVCLREVRVWVRELYVRHICEREV